MTLEEFLDDWHSESDVIRVQTSGSTGEPKSLYVEKARMVASAESTCRFLGLKRGDRALLCLSLDYIAGKMMVVRAECMGLRLDSVAPCGHPLAESQSETYDFVAMVPMQVYNTLADANESARLRRIRHLIIGGGAIDEALERVLRDMPNCIWSTYGMTETLSHIALRRVNGPQASEWYTPLPGVEVSVDSDGRLLVNAPRVCAEVLITNDIAEIDTATGRFKILGRIDNVVCSGGIKIQIEEVERRLREHITVPFLITSRRDEKFGEVLVLLYEGSNPEEKADGGHRLLQQTALKDICEKTLPKYTWPKAYIRVDHLPLTPTGKPARAAARILAG